VRLCGRIFTSRHGQVRVGLPRHHVSTSPRLRRTTSRRQHVYVYTERDGRKGPKSEAKLGATANALHKARPRNAKRGKKKSAKPTHGAQSTPQPPKATEGLDRHRHEGQGGGHLPLGTPIGGVTGSSSIPGGARSAPSIGGSRRVDDGNVTHHKPARKYKHDVPPGLRIRGEGGHRESPGSGRGFVGQERGPGRPAAPERPPGPAQGRRG
jgi:hypothetical protein